MNSIQDFKTYYSSHSINSYPGKYIELLRKLPYDIEELCNIVYGLIIHYNNTQDIYGFKPKLSEIKEVNTRYIDLLKIFSNIYKLFSIAAMILVMLYQYQFFANWLAYSLIPFSEKN